MNNTQSLSGFFWLFSFCQAVLHQRKQRKHLWQIWFSNQIINKQKQREEIERLFSSLIYSVIPLSQFSLSCDSGDGEGLFGYTLCVLCFLTALRLSALLCCFRHLWKSNHTERRLSHTLQTTAQRLLCLCGHFTQHLYISPQNRLKSAVLRNVFPSSPWHSHTLMHSLSVHPPILSGLCAAS